jgi:rhodanese-related sulfurtransferase
MRANLSVLALGAAMLFAGHDAPAQETPASAEGIRVVAAEQVRDLAARGAAVVDTRTANEYAERTIKGALSVPYKEKSAKAASFDKAQDSFDIGKLPQDKSAPIVFFCNAGTCWKSFKASVVARDGGYRQVHWFRGGLPEWVAKGLPTQ